MTLRAPSTHFDPCEETHAEKIPVQPPPKKRHGLPPPFGDDAPECADHHPAGGCARRIHHPAKCGKVVKRVVTFKKEMRNLLVFHRRDAKGAEFLMAFYPAGTRLRSPRLCVENWIRQETGVNDNNSLLKRELFILRPGCVRVPSPCITFGPPGAGGPQCSGRRGRLQRRRCSSSSGSVSRRD